jgi:hypothetical protein
MKVVAYENECDKQKFNGSEPLAPTPSGHFRPLGSGRNHANPALWKPATNPA